jgi:hypothetical protein
MTSEREPKRFWWASLVYALLGVALVSTIWSRLSARPAKDKELDFQQLSDPFAGAPPIDPLAVSADAPRVVRWCQVREVLERRCQRCHGNPTAHGAPVSFVSYADTQREQPPGSGWFLAERMNFLVRHRVMPPTTLPLDPPVEPLSEREKDILLVWLEEGALAIGGTDCPSRVQ